MKVIAGPKIEQKISEYVARRLHQPANYDYGELEAMNKTLGNIRQFLGELVDAMIQGGPLPIKELFNDPIEIIDQDYSAMIAAFGYTWVHGDKWPGQMWLVRADGSHVAWSETDTRIKYFTDPMHAYMFLIGKEDLL